MTQDGSDPLQDVDPWSVQNSKGRTRPAEPAARTLACFVPPGLGAISSIVPKESPKEQSSEGRQEQPPLVEQPGVQARLSRDELVKGMDLIQGLLDEQMAESEKREQALELARAAGVPWRRNDIPPPEAVHPRPPRHKSTFSFDWCDCGDGECKPDGERGF